MFSKGFFFLISFTTFNNYGFSKRIIDGDLAMEGEFPYVAILKGKSLSGAAIINRNHILTSAWLTKDLHAPYDDVTVGTGNVDRRKMIYHKISRISVHPRFGKRYPEAARYNIAIITLCKPIKFNTSQRPVKLPIEPVQDGATGVLVGWGIKKESSGSVPRSLRKLNVTVYGVETCSKGDDRFDDKSQICTINTPGTGACLGDEGGPLVVNGTIVGIVYESGCGRRKDIYTNVYECMDFIKDQIDPRICRNPSYATTVMTRIEDDN